MVTRMGEPEGVSVQTDRAGQVVAASGPGLVDIQVNGYAGFDFNDPPERMSREALRRALEAMRRRGVAAILATVTTEAIPTMLARVARLADLRREDDLAGEMIAGFHVEGPFISREDGPRGAHPREHPVTPEEHPRLLDDFQEAGGGLVRLLTLAPELPGAMELIARAAGAGVTVALGHHSASPEVLDEAVRAGATLCTHLGNGSHALLPRLDNYVQRQLADDRLAASFIPDGHHVPFATLKNFLRAKQVHRSILVTDAVAAADSPPGVYGSGRRARRVGPDGAIRLEGTPYLAGSALTLDRGVLNVVGHCDVTFEQAWAMASTQAARIVALPEPPRISVEVSPGGFRRAGG
jgi:N-acetylglucosamine-6-phosphate deacetylase